MKYNYPNIYRLFYSTANGWPELLQHIRLTMIAEQI